MADVRLFPLEAELVLLVEVLFINSVINEIPRKLLIQLLRPVDKEIGLTSLCVKAFDQLSS